MPTSFDELHVGRIFVDGVEVSPVSPQEGGPCLPAFPDSEATTVRGLRDDYNALLALLRYVGMMEVGDVH